MSQISLFLFCPKLSHSEDDAEKKIIAFFPPDYNQVQQSILQGLVEGTSAFISQFSGGHGCEMVNGERLSCSILSCDHNCYLVLVADDAHNNANRQSILKHCFNMLELLNGSLFRSISGEEEIRLLRQNARRFLNCYGQCIPLGSLYLSATLEGFAFLSVDRLIYCSLNCFVNKVESLDNEGGKFICLLYGQKMLWSCSEEKAIFYWLEQDQFKLLKKEYSQEAFTAGADKRHVSAIKFWDKDGDSWFWAISVNIDQLCIYYRINECALKAGLQLMSSLDVISILSELKSFSKLRSASEPVRFLYFNGVNLAIKCNLPLQYPESSLQNQCLGIIRSMQETFRSSEETLDIVVQTKSSRWVVGKRFPISKREYFMLADESFSDIEQVESEIIKMENTSLGSVSLI